jgi:lysophospholipase L1-like esterase
MSAYLDAIAPEVWLATENSFTSDLTTDQVKLNAKARNAIFEAISEEVFARVNGINLACDI